MKKYLKTFYHWMFSGAKSYSQTGEDLIAAFFLSGIKQGFYVDIGANDPIYMNNTYLFYKKGWQGVCVDPDVYRCRLIKKIRLRDEVINEGLAGSPGLLDFYLMEPDTLSTFSKIEADELQKQGHKIKQVQKIKVSTLANFFTQYAAGRAIDLLSLDTEGMDLEILQSNDWERFRPKIIIAEIIKYQEPKSTRVNKPFDHFFKQHGYLKLADTYINGIYIEKDYAKSRNLDENP